MQGYNKKEHHRMVACGLVITAMMALMFPEWQTLNAGSNVLVNLFWMFFEPE